MHVNPSSFPQIERKSSFPPHSPFVNTMIFEIENSGAAVAAPPAPATKQAFKSRKIHIHPPPPSSASLNKGNRPLHRHTRSASTDSFPSGRFAELAGGTTAECASICCCCPYTLVNLVYLTVYKVPAGLCRRALRRKRMKELIKKGLLPVRAKRCRCVFDDSDILIHPSTGLHDLLDVRSDSEAEEEEEAIEKLEKEMWENFYSTGFWRSPSQK
ncbi:uncharacterized protein LOC110622480 [Manihot esculenta]|uniref:Uncharacterized protein n=1 Tax=Manihot esculenta TaxID=3983 RepID=A0A2C9V7S3_MANES|nr:uncharacterized protein LOC110622480 [Manihot esculenta]OAY40696.1 hypothetical protein MANES_09G042300v8 [Manihot esculenta]